MFAPTMLAAAIAVSGSGHPSHPAAGVNTTAVQPSLRGPQTNETVEVKKGSRLRLENFAGEVVVRTWNRDSVQIVARHDPRVTVAITPAAAALTIQSRSSGRGSVDYEITTPHWMPLSITGTYNFITVEGAQSDVSAETTRGDISIKGGTGAVVAKSIEGQVVIEGARGRITASSVNERVRVTDATGDLTIDTTNGDVTLTQIRSSNANVTTVNGDIRFEGAPAPSGRYRLTTHNGDIITTMPDTSNATFVIRTYQGDFGSTLNVSGPPRGEARLGRRQTYTLGNGSAEFELETFGGSIRLRGPAAATPAKAKEEKSKRNGGL
jgi:hypothetical protein